jgi:hypothetical protein
MKSYFSTLTLLILVHACFAFEPDDKKAVESELVKITLTGHVKRKKDEGITKEIRIPSKIHADISKIVDSHGGFDPSEQFANEGPPTVAWIERTGDDDQHIIIDYKNKQILSQRKVDEKWKLERYDWETFEYKEGDFLFICTSRKSLDLAFIPVRYVQDQGWKGFEKLNYYGKTKEESEAIDSAKKKAEQAGAGQPATRPESKPEGNDKPQTKSEGRSR